MRQRIIGTEIINYENSLDDTIEKNIIPRINEMQNVFNNIEWKGIGKDSFVNSYDEVLFELKKIPNVLKLYVKFLNSSMTDYEDLMMELKKQYDDFDGKQDIVGDQDDK
jgi:hypothetical protein